MAQVVWSSVNGDARVVVVYASEAPVAVSNGVELDEVPNLPSLSLLFKFNLCINCCIR